MLNGPLDVVRGDLERRPGLLGREAHAFHQPLPLGAFRYRQYCYASCLTSMSTCSSTTASSRRLPCPGVGRFLRPSFQLSRRGRSFALFSFLSLLFLLLLVRDISLLFFVIVVIVIVVVVLQSTKKERRRHKCYGVDGYMHACVIEQSTTRAEKATHIKNRLDTKK